MKIHKLNAITSTSDYLKALVSTTRVANYTVVHSNYQTLGKGQLDNTWHSKKDKNLLFSVLVRFENFSTQHQTYLNFAISLAIYDALSRYLPNIKIKWPNDILSPPKKLCGILVENVVKNDKITHSIVGIGININQLHFPNHLPNATSLKVELNHSFKRMKILKEIVTTLQTKIHLLEAKQFDELKNFYEKNLFKINTPAMFSSKTKPLFMGKIVGVSSEGELLIELEDETIEAFAHKTIRFY